jgi:hypothetical protein
LYHRFLMGAGYRRAIVYLIAAALVVISGIFAVRLARPADPFGPVRVQQVSGSAAERGAQTEQVQWDAEKGRGILDVRESDGAVRRYYMEDSGGNRMRVWGGDEVEPEDTGGG